jgi:Flp pilus assembly protein TadD
MRPRLPGRAASRAGLALAAAIPALLAPARSAGAQDDAAPDGAAAGVAARAPAVADPGEGNGTPASPARDAAAAAAVDRGLERLDRGDWTGALLVLRPALAEREDDPRLQGALTRAYSEIGEDAPPGSRAQLANFERGLEHARRRLELAPQSSEAHLDVAVMLGKIARASGAGTKLRLAPDVAAEARRAIELDPESWRAYHVLGVWHREIATLGGLKKLGASLLGGLPDASLEEAIANLETAGRLAPGSIRNHLELGRTYEKADRDADARAEFERAVELPPAEPRDPALQREARRELAALGP